MRMDGGQHRRTDGVCADPLCVVEDAMYSWPLMWMDGWMDGGGVGRRAWGCKKMKKERKRKVLLTRMDSGRRVWVVAI